MLFHFSLTLLACAASARATIAPTSPIATTVCIGNNICTISWVDDGATPSVASFGPTSLGLYVGSTTQQTLVQSLGTVSRPDRTTSINVNINANSGPDGSFYFIRFQSNSATLNGAPLQAFSSSFTLAGMTGQLSAAASAQIVGLVSTSSPTLVTTTVTSSLAPASSSQSPSLAPNIFAGSGAEHQTVGLTVIFIACILTLFLLD